jgi:hypothetical protein
MLTSVVMALKTLMWTFWNHHHVFKSLWEFFVLHLVSSTVMWWKTVIMMICYLFVGHHRDLHKFVCIISLHNLLALVLHSRCWITNLQSNILCCAYQVVFILTLIVTISLHILSLSLSQVLFMTCYRNCDKGCWYVTINLAECVHYCT